MKRELFDKELTCHNYNITSSVKKLYKQERDWTCAIACLRTITNSDKSEDWFIEKLNVKPGPIYSNDIQKLNLNGVYGYNNKIDFDEILELLKTHNIMLECCINYVHWVVLLGYYYFDSDNYNNYCLIYDPYYDELRLVHTEELISMWCDINIERDYVAIKNK